MADGFEFERATTRKTEENGNDQNGIMFKWKWIRHRHRKGRIS